MKGSLEPHVASQAGMAEGKARATATMVHHDVLEGASADRASERGPQRPVGAGPGKWGALRLTTMGRRSGEPRSVILGHFEDGPNLVSMAMNGWGAAEPAWWLNLQADPQAVVDLAGGIRRTLLGRPAVGSERERLWQCWRELDRNLDSYAARRPRETAVVVLEPPPAASRPSSS